jgi:predicted ATPase/DNA-binding XRE family transcriptional regulator
MVSRLAGDAVTTIEIGPESFGVLLRRHRLAAGLSQEMLGERARLSANSIAALERGRRTAPRQTTVVQLARALSLTPADRSTLVAAAARVHAIKLADRNAMAPPSGGPKRRHNLPVPRTSFVARAAEPARVLQRLRESRLLTITGSGGCGKTRLALEVAGQLIDQFPDGVWLVELDSLTDTALVSQTVASTFGIRDEPGRTIMDALTDYLRSQHVLLILDNCEHVIDACAHVADTLLRSCANVHVLATSRELLGVAGEAPWRVTSLAVVDPPNGAEASGDLAEKVLASESGRLFVDRARLAVPSFAVNADNALAVAQVCRRLDGIPLAIELAAARLSMLSVDQIAARLDQRFRLLTGGNRTAVRRQQTLQATIDWSYQLLPEEERSLVRGLAVFADGWSLEAAEALGADPVGSGEAVLELLSRLVAKSMVLVDEPQQNEPRVVRYRFLETIRQYAEEKLLEAGDAETQRTRHRDWYLCFAEQGMQGIDGVDEKHWWDRLDLEYDNLRMALTWSAADPGDSTKLLHLAGLLGRFWLLRGYAREGIGWLETAIARSDTAPSSARAVALNWLGALEVFNGNLKRACPLLEESLAQARTIGDRRVLVLALQHLSLALRSMGDLARGLPLIEEALAVSREDGYKREITWNLAALASNLASAGHFEAAEPLLLESVVVGRQSGDITPVLAATGALARLCLLRGDLARARRTVHKALALAGQTGMQLPIAHLLVTLGDIACAEADWTSADDRYRQALSAAGLAGARGVLAHTLRHYAAMCAALGDPGTAVRIFGATSTIRHLPILAIVDVPVAEDEIVAAAQQALGADAFGAAWAAGQSMTLEEMTTGLVSPR